jgi:multiple sugar transport system permease protein
MRNNCWCVVPSHYPLGRERLWSHQSGSESALIFARTWKGVHFMAIMILAALQTFPEELREAAIIDGASRRQIFFRVVISYLKVPFLFILVLQTINAVKLFETVYILTRGGPGNATRVVFLYSYEQAFEIFNLG